MKVSFNCFFFSGGGSLIFTTEITEKGRINDELWSSFAHIHTHTHKVFSCCFVVLLCTPFSLLASKNLAT
jgi:hypothetical protein